MRKLPLALRLGLLAMALGAAPLLAFLAADWLGMVSDPDPNPIGLGLLFGAGMLLGQALCAIGLASLAMRRWAR